MQTESRQLTLQLMIQNHCKPSEWMFLFLEQVWIMRLILTAKIWHFSQCSFLLFLTMRLCNFSNPTKTPTKVKSACNHTDMVYYRLLIALERTESCRNWISFTSAFNMVPEQPQHLMSLLSPDRSLASEAAAT